MAIMEGWCRKHHQTSLTHRCLPILQAHPPYQAPGVSVRVMLTTAPLWHEQEKLAITHQVNSTCNDKYIVLRPQPTKTDKTKNKWITKEVQLKLVVTGIVKQNTREQKAQQLGWGMRKEKKTQSCERLRMVWKR